MFVKRTSKRALSLLLVLTMLMGLVPWSLVSFGAESVLLDSAIFCSDVHGSTSDLSSVLGGIKNGGVQASAIGFAGDTCLTVSTTESTVSSALGYSPAVVFSYAAGHDTSKENGCDISTNWDDSKEAFSNDYYYIYTITETDMETTSDATTESKEFTTWVEAADKNKPVFIISHKPLHDRRNDNAGAAVWYDAISAAAEKMDIVFFWAHNHTSESDVDTAAYYVEKNGSESITVEGGSTVVPNFTYMNAGYINANNQNPGRRGVATTVGIWSDKLVFQDYNSSGEYTGTHAHNVTVEFEFADLASEPELKTVTGYDEYNVISVSATAYDLTDITVTNTSGDIDFGDAFTDSVSFEVALDGHTDGNEVKYSVYLVDDMDTTNLKLCYIDDSGELIPLEYTVTTSGQYSYIEFTTTYVGAFVYGAEGIPDGAVLTGVRVTPPETLKYFVGDTLDPNASMVVTAVYSVNGSEWTRQVWHTEDPTYELDFNMNTVGKQTVTVTYCGFTDSFDIELFQKVFPDEATGVVSTVTAHGATGFSVTDVHDDELVASTAATIFGGTYTAYDMTLTGYNQGEEVEISYPVPEGVNADMFAVYHLASNGTVERMEGELNSAKTAYVFTTDHFSVYFGGESYEPVDATVEYTTTVKDTTTTTTTINKTVYKLVSTPSANKNYLLVSSNSAGSANALKVNDLNGATVTINAKTDDIDAAYIEIDDASLVWATQSGMKFGNNGTYLTYGNGLEFNTTGTDWTVGTNTARYVEDGGWVDTYYYITYTNNSWSLAESSSWFGSASYVYFYEETTVTVTEETTEETETEVTVKETYSIAGNPEEITLVVKEGTTKALGSTLTKTPEGGTATTEDVSTTATYTIVSDPSGILSGIDGNTATFTGAFGTALVKVSYEGTVGEGDNQKSYTVENYIVLIAKDATYTIELHKSTIDENGNVTVGEEITTPLGIKNVKAGDTYSVWAVIKKYDGVLDDNGEDGEDIGDVEDSLITWTSTNNRVATVDPATGVITFTGEEGTIKITASYKVDDDTQVVDIITVTASKSNYTTPSDGTNDFPEYPNEGSVRFDKNATAVGNFTETGITQIELSMTGVPYSTGNEMDVVVMLDITGSMTDTDDRIPATKAAAIAFVESIVINEDGTYNDNRVGIYWFNKNGAGTVSDLGAISSKEELETVTAAINAFDDNYASGGTPYDEGLKECYDVLNTAKAGEIGKDRQQFCVFMTDGCPTSYQYINGTSNANYSSASSIKGMFTGTNYDTRDTDYYYEYYSTQMKAAGVTVYTVGLGLNNKNSAWSGSSATQCLNAASILLNDISGPANETTQPDATGTSTLSKKDQYFFSVDDADAASEMKNVFSAIAQKILEAAKNVVVEDKISDDYTMVFAPPNADVETALGGQDLYIEVVEYALKAVTDADGNVIDYVRDTEASLSKIYLALNSNKEYYAASDSKGTAYAAPVFEAAAEGVKAYWTTEAISGAVKVTVDGTTYYFDATGEGTHVMTSGAYAYGTLETENIVSEETSQVIDTNTTSQNLVIVTPYFVYDASTRILVWTTEKLSSSELALRYFLYLNNSAGWEEAAKAMEAGTYTTNDYATITYKNFQDTEVQQFLPVPQMTWNGAQVSYVFYLVNSKGQPVNRAGRVVPFSEAVYVTDVYTYAMTWNDLEENAYLEAEYLAQNLVPDVYELFDSGAQYQIHVFEDENGSNLNNHFVIQAGTSTYTTYVFNTKAGTKYNVPDIYIANDGNDSITSTQYLCKDYEGVTVNRDESGNITSCTYNGSNTQVAPTQYAGCEYRDNNGYVYYEDADGNVYTIVRKSDGTEVEEGFDFANTTVAFAVVWKPQLKEDTIVVDFGLSVNINVSANDVLASGVVGVRTDAPTGITINSGTFTPIKETSIKADLFTASILSLTSIKFQLTSMNVSEPIVFYYESDANYYVESALETKSMYSSVTVIPATTVYYEETFVKFEDSTAVTEGSTLGVWVTDGEDDTNSVQATDRPGTNVLLGQAYDANNAYGYDAEYGNWTEFSNGGAAKVTVDKTTGKNGVAPYATFTFTGTGFDVISLTDNDSGFIMVTVKDAGGTVVAKKNVDNYYGYNFCEYYKTVYTYTVDDEGNASWIPVTTEITSDIYNSSTSESKPTTGLVSGETTYTVYGTDKWIVDESSEDAIWQVPVIKINGLAYGTYTVTINVAYMSIADHTKDGSYSFWLDAIRIYDPAKGNTVAEDAYSKDEESNPDYVVLKDIILDSANLTTGGAINGIVFIDGIDATSDAKDYADPGPNNETYLAQTQSVAFKLVADKKPDKIMIGVKLAQGSSAKLMIGETEFVTVTTATDMYYDLSDHLTWTENSSGMYETGVITLSNATSGAVISLTNLKAINAEFQLGAATAALSLEEDDGIATVSAIVDEEVLTTAAFTLAKLYAPVPEVDPFEAEYVSVQTRVGKANKATYVTVVTSDDVESVTVHGKEITTYAKVPTVKFHKGKVIVEYYRVWTYVAKLTEGTYIYDIVVYDAEGNASEEIETEFTVKTKNKK